MGEFAHGNLADSGFDRLLVISDYAGSRAMANMLVLMLSSFPAGTYAAGAIGDSLMEKNNLINGFFGYLL